MSTCFFEFFFSGTAEFTTQDFNNSIELTLPEIIVRVFHSVVYFSDLCVISQGRYCSGHGFHSG